MRVSKDERGITLIALVITIIVMLILVAVTINMAVNGGLFGYAGNATRETEKEKQAEQDWVTLIDNMSTEQLIKKYTNEHHGIREEDTFTCTICNAKYTMGDVVNYSTNPSNTTKIIKEEDSGTQEQTVTAETSLRWIILGLDENEVLLITTERPTVGKLKLAGAKAYTNGPRIMNEICKEFYSNSEYGEARSIKIEDINYVLNYTYTNGSIISSMGVYRVQKGTKFGDIGNGKMREEVWDAMKDNNTTPEPGKNLTDYEIDGYFYNIPFSATATEIKTIADSNKNFRYWLASRGAYGVATSGLVCFDPGVFGGNYLENYMGTFYSDGSSNTANDSIRPVVPLKKKLPDILESNTDSGNLPGPEDPPVDVAV